MFVRCWGARGSIPISGKDFDRYGGDTTCLEVHSNDDQVIIIDAGSGIRRLGNQLINGKHRKLFILFTHIHWDHILGLPFFKPVYSKDFSVHIYGCPFFGNSFKKLLSETMIYPYFPVKFNDLQAKVIYHEVCKKRFSIGSIHVTPIFLSHPNQGIGYKFIEEDTSFVFLTDNELTYTHPGGLDRSEYVEFAKGADLLIHDAEYNEKEYRMTKMWGHTVYTDALELALDARVKRFGLFHHNQNRTDKALDAMVKDCRAIVRKKKRKLSCFAVAQGQEISL
jgi:phosphoribosyl 1,2-cyclic phosphodiesterase